MFFLKNYNFRDFYSSKEKKSIKFFFFLSIIGMILEMLGVGLIVPFLSILVEPTFSSNAILLLNNFGLSLSGQESLVIFSIIIILTIFLIKTLFLSYISFKQIKFLINFKTDISDKLYRIYLYKPFIFHLNSNSSKLIRDLNDSTQVLVVTKSILTLVSEITILVGIISLMLFLEPFGTLISSFFIFVSGYLFYKIVQKKASQWGKDRMFHEGIKLQLLQQSFSSIKDISIINKFEYFINLFAIQNKRANETQFKQDFTLSLPRLWLELFTVTGSTIFLFILLNLKKDISNVIPILGFFAAATFKIVPSITRIMNSLQSIKFGLPAAKTYVQEFNNFKEKISGNNFSNKLNFKKSIELKEINFTYPNTKKKILNNINMKILYGSSIGICGDSGVGKSTFLNVFLQLLKPQSGKIFLDGEDIDNFTVRQWQDIMGYVPQNVYLNDDTLIKNIALGVDESQIDINKINFIIKKIKLENFLSSLKDGLNTKVGEYGDRISGGQKQRIGIARALYNDPKILILDEYTSSLDEQTEKEIVKEINSLKFDKTIITITHKKSSLLLCDEIYKLTEDNGMEKIEL